MPASYDRGSHFPGLFTGHDPARGLDQEFFENRRVESGRVMEVFEISRVGSGRIGLDRVRKFSEFHGVGRGGADHGRVKSGQKYSKFHGSGRVGPRWGRIGSDWIGSDRIGSKSFPISRVGSGRVESCPDPIRPLRLRRDKNREKRAILPK